jgi:hypothetical protein
LKLGRAEVLDFRGSLWVFENEKINNFKVSYKLENVNISSYLIFLETRPSFINQL